jgi:hypothetical protein
VSRKRKIPPGAFVSGQAALAIFRDAQGYSYRHVGERLSRECRAEDVPYLFGGATDVITIIGKSTEQVVRILENEAAQDQALHLILIILDSDAHLRAKSLASEAFEALIGSPTIRQFVLDRVYTRPLPACADTADALRRCIDASRKATWALVSELRSDQAVIESVRGRWERIGSELFRNAEEKAVVERVAIEEGIFFTICKHPERITAEAIDQWASDPRLHNISAKEVLRYWAGVFHVGRKESTPATQLDLFAQASG